MSTLPLDQVETEVAEADSELENNQPTKNNENEASAQCAVLAPNITGTLEIRIDTELQEWIEPLSAEEYALLEANILQDGCRDPLVIWNGYLLDGHNRYAICTQYGIAFQTFEKTGLDTKADVKIWMIENQLGKRNTTDFGRAVLALKLKPLLEQRAKDRMLAGKADPTQISAEGTGETRKAVAKAAGVSHDTVRKVEKILDQATPDVIAKVRTGEISINAAAKTVAPPKPEKEIVVAAPAVTHPAPDVDAEPEPENYGPSTEEIATALKAEADQFDYFKKLMELEDDPLTKALADVKMLGEQVRVAREINNSLQNEKNELIRTIKSLQGKLKKLEVTK